MKSIMGLLLALFFLAAPASAQINPTVPAKGPGGTILKLDLQSVLGQIRSQFGVMPDWYKVSADGADDAPSIVRAQASGLPLAFACRHYAINSAITIASLPTWNGCGSWNESRMLPAVGGTWFDINASFAGTGVFPITFSGSATGGGLVQNISVSEPQVDPGASATTFTPIAIPAVFSEDGVAGRIEFRHIFMLNVYDGFRSVNSGRTYWHDISGQVFHNMFYVDIAKDSVIVDNIHQWVFWSTSPAVQIYQQQNLDTLVSYRNDSPFVDKLFTFDAHSAIRMGSSSSGETTGAMFGSIQCDATDYCLWVDSTALATTFQANMVRSFGYKAQQTAYTGATQMQPNAASLIIDGVATAHIESILDYGSDNCAICISSYPNSSIVTVGMLDSQNTQYQSANSSLIFAVNTTGAGTSVTFSQQPLIQGALPAGYRPLLPSVTNALINQPAVQDVLGYVHAPSGRLSGLDTTTVPGGNVQSSAAQLNSEITYVNGAFSAGQGVIARKCDVMAPGATSVFINGSPAALALFPQPGYQINGLTANAAANVPSGYTMSIICDPARSRMYVSQSVGP